MNDNFSTFRGHIISVDLTAGAAAPTLTFDLGASDRRWRNGYLSPILAVASTSASYTLLTTDHVFLGNAAAGAITITLPAVANIPTGKLYEVKKTDSSNGNAITIDGNAAETIDGALTTTINTQYESIKIISDGSNWHLLDRVIPSVWTAYTPTGAWTTNATYTGFWRRVGDSMQVMAKIALAGAPDALDMSISIPSGYTIDTAKIVDASLAVFGRASAWDSGVANYTGNVIYSGTTTVRANSHTGSVWSNTIPFTFGAADSVNIIFIVPITGWKG